MDFSIFDHPDGILPLTWLGRQDWMIFKDIPEERAISAKPKKLVLHAKEIKPDTISVNEKEMRRYPQEMWRTLKRIIEALEYNVVGTLWYDTLAKALADGPKIFRPTALQCEALENAEARYSFKDYKQPFPVITLEIPDEYSNQLKEKYKIENSPKYVLVNHDEQKRFINVSAFYSKNSIITHITPDRAEYDTIEDSLVKNRDRRNNRVEDDLNGEFDAAENVQRLAINFAMMMSLYTLKEIVPLDPLNFRIWQQDARPIKNGVITKRAVDAQRKLAAAMHLIQFDQSVEFYDEIEENVEIGQSVDIDKLHRSPKSHWRRGHFAMQPCGVGRLERKMIFRKPVLVRAKYFLGDIKDSSVTYTIHPSRKQ